MSQYIFILTLVLLFTLGVMDSQKSLYIPDQVHIAVFNTDSITVSWHIDANDTTAQSNLYWWGAESVSSSVSPKSATALGHIYPGSRGAFYHAVMSPMSYDTVYHYYIRDEVHNTQSKEFSTVLKSPGFKRQRIVILGDQGVLNSSSTMASVSKMVQDDKVEMIIHVGDIGYPDDNALHSSNDEKYCINSTTNPNGPVVFEKVWNQYMNDIEPWASKVPYHVAPGNHESSYYSDPQCESKSHKARLFTPYNYRFNMPKWQESKNMFYSFDYGLVHYIALSSETDYPNSPPFNNHTVFGDQMSWVKQDLASVDRSKTPWIIAYFHRPVYTSDVFGYDKKTERPVSTCKYLQDAFENLFIKYQVSFVFHGHVHDLELNHYVYNGKKLSSSFSSSKYLSPIYAVSGAAGSIEGHTFHPKGHSYPSWNFFTGPFWGYTVLDIFNSTTANLKMIHSDTGNSLVDVIIQAPYNYIS